MASGKDSRSSPLSHHFRYMGQYNKHCTKRLLDFVRKEVSNDTYRKDINLFFRSIHGTLNHILGADQLWYSRLSSSAMPIGVCPIYELEGKELGKAWENRVSDMDDLFTALLDQCNAWNKLLFDKDDSWCMETVTYIDTEGFPTEIVRCAGLSQAFNHSTHHRGQLSAAICNLNMKCPSFDMQTMGDQFLGYTLKIEHHEFGSKKMEHEILTTPRKV